MATKMRPTKAAKPKAERVKRDAEQEITNKIIKAFEEALEAAEKGEKVILPWSKEWATTGFGGMPTSLATGKLYRGSNTVALWFAAMENGYTSQYWGTYDQMAERAGLVRVERRPGDPTGGHYWVSPTLEDGSKDPQPRGVRRGEVGTVIVRWLFFDQAVIDPDTNRPVLKPDGTVKKARRAVPRVWLVYNADQCEFPEGSKGVPITPTGPTGIGEDDFNPIEAAEEIIHEYLHEREGHPSLRHGGSRAYYAPAKDHIQMPKKGDFTSPEGYYSTLFHECGHSTGATKRNNREGIREGTFGAFGDKVYSFEELVAEISAAFLCGLSGIAQDATFDNSVAYIQHWLGKLREDKKLIIRAANQAQKAVDCITGYVYKSDEEETEPEEVAS